VAACRCTSRKAARPASPAAGRSAE